MSAAPDSHTGSVMQAESLTRHYGVSQGFMKPPLTVKALVDVSFSLAAGQTLAVVGESGCGKSTLARQLTLIEPPTAGRLRIGDVDLLHLPGELFVEYQLAAQQLRPEAAVCVAAYGDYGCGYIGLHDSYAQGGYETSDVASRVAPSVEGVLMGGIEELLKD